MGELFYRIINHQYLYKRHRSLPVTISPIDYMPVWRMNNGKKILISDMDSRHLRNTIKMLERNDPYLNEEFQEFLEDEDLSYHAIYMLTFVHDLKRNGHKMNELKHFFFNHMHYFCLRREEIHRMKNFEREMWNNVRSKQSQRNYEPVVNGNP